MKYCLILFTNKYSCMPIILSGKCFVIDKETQTNQNTLVPAWLHSFITPARLHLPFLKTASVLFNEGKTV